MNAREARNIFAAFAAMYGASALAPNEAEAMPRVYHGTGGWVFSKLDPNRAVRNYMGKGIHVSESPELASHYAMQHSRNQRVMPLEMPDNLKLADKDTYLKVATDVSKDTKYSDKSWDEEVTGRLKAMGYEGVKYQHEPIHVFDEKLGKLVKVEQPRPSYAVFNADKLKSSFSGKGMPLRDAITKMGVAAPVGAVLAEQLARKREMEQRYEGGGLQEAVNPVEYMIPGRFGGGLANMGFDALIDYLFGQGGQ